MKNSFPLCVDLDGTLIQSDTLIEAFFQLIRKNVFNVILSVYWLLQGKSVLKSRISERVDLNPALLPYNKILLRFLKKEKSEGRQLILVTACHEKFANRIADYLKLFDSTFATKEGTNLLGLEKLKILQKNYGEKGFDYAGNSIDDLNIWPHARKAILVNPDLGVKSAAQKLTSIERTFDNRQVQLRDYVKALRTHQWVKNALIFIPFITAHQWGRPEILIQTFIAFLAFSLCASSVYILNDLIDLPEDRQHPRKRFRPFASGLLSIQTGVVLSAALLFLSFLLAAMVNLPFVMTLGFYYLITLGYSTYFKRIVLVDVFILAGLYTLRIIAGTAAISTETSFWLLAFSIFVFLSLAMVKRFSELQVVIKGRKRHILGRGYVTEDLETLIVLGSASGYMAALVLALYIDTPTVAALYTKPEVLWLLCPLILFWISRIWLASKRKQMHDDPIIFALKDYVSRWVGVIAILIFLYAL